MKTILITGASSGIGEATARHFQANGWNVIATMRRIRSSGEIRDRQNVPITEFGARFRSFHNDVAKCFGGSNSMGLP